MLWRMFDGLLNTAEWTSSKSQAELMKQQVWLTSPSSFELRADRSLYHSTTTVMLHDSAPEPLESQNASTLPTKSSAREAFFLSFSHSAKQLLSSLDATTLPSPPPAILVTGGFRTRSTMAASLLDSATDLVGIGRPACADPYLPLTLLNSGIDKARSEPYAIKGTALLKHLPIGIIGPGLSTVFHTILLGMIAKGEKPDVRISIWEGAWRLWLEDLVGGWIWYAWLGVVMAVGYVVVTVGQ